MASLAQPPEPIGGPSLARTILVRKSSATFTGPVKNECELSCYERAKIFRLFRGPKRQAEKTQNNRSHLKMPDGAFCPLSGASAQVGRVLDVFAPPCPERCCAKPVIGYMSQKFKLL